MSSVLRLLERTGSLTDPDKALARGRPAYPTHNLRLKKSLPYRIALEVAELTERLGGKNKRGNAAEAIREVAQKYSKRKNSKFPFVSEPTVKTYYKRYGQQVHVMAKALVWMDETFKELDRRMLAFPDDVAKAFDKVPYATLLQWLQKNGIDGTCPAEVIAKIRQRNIE